MKLWVLLQGICRQCQPANIGETMYQQATPAVNPYIHTCLRDPPQHIVLMVRGQLVDIPRIPLHEEYLWVGDCVARGWTALYHDGALRLHPVVDAGALEHLGWAA